MSELPPFDFRLIGSFTTHYRDDHGGGVIERLVWECRACHALTNSPDAHWREDGMETEARIER